MSHFPAIVCDSPIYGACKIVNHRDRLSALPREEAAQRVYGVSKQEM